MRYDEVQDKIRIKSLERRFSVGKILSMSEIVEPQQKLGIVKEDSDDNKVLECAKEGKVEFIISQDKHLLRLKSFENMPILKPEEFLQEMKSNKL